MMSTINNHRVYSVCLIENVSSQIRGWEATVTERRWYTSPAQLLKTSNLTDFFGRSDGSANEPASCASCAYLADNQESEVTEQQATTGRDGDVTDVVDDRCHWQWCRNLCR